MFKIVVWVRKKEGMDDIAFRQYWLGKHVPLVRGIYTRLDTYTIEFVIGSLPRGDPPFSGIATLAWGTREDFDADVRSPEVKAIMADFAGFASQSGTVFVETHDA